MAGGVEEDPEGRAGLMRMLGRAQLEHGGLGNIEIVDDHVDVHLLGVLLAGPLRRPITLDGLERHRVAVVRADLPPGAVVAIAVAVAGAVAITALDLPLLL